MGKRKYLLGLVLLTGLAACLWLWPGEVDPWAFRVEIPVTDENNPFTEARLLARLDRIKPLVEAVVGDPIRTDDLRIDMVDGFVAAERALTTFYPDLVDPAHADYTLAPPVITLIGLQQYWGSLLARYAPEDRTLELFPFMFEVLKPEDPGALLDVVLAHELTHVWQTQRFDMFQHEGVESTLEAELARAAVVEGTAEFVCREVAKQLGIAPSFDLIVSRRETKQAMKHGPAAQRELAPWRRWVYAAGLEFVDVIHAHFGPEKTWALLFGAMPTNVWSIEHPRAWIARPGVEVADLDGLADRLLWTLEAVRSKYEFQRKWSHRPLLRSDLEARLASTGLSPASGPWTKCRGGLLFAGEPKRGPLAGTGFVLRAWRFPTHAEALEARQSLERAFEALGPRAWASGAIQDVVGAERLIAGAGGALVRSSLVFDDAAFHAHEGAWGIRVDESLLFEVQCWRDGAGAALLDLLDAAAAARALAETIEGARDGTAPSASPYAMLEALRRTPPVHLERLAVRGPPPLRDEILAQHLALEPGEQQVLGWLVEHPAEVTAWMTALGPAAGHESEQGTERGQILAAALVHEDDAVIRFALGAIAENRTLLPPWSADVLSLVAALTTHEHAWVRSAAVRAAEALADQTPLTGDRIDALAADASPAVRASLALSRALLKSQDRFVPRRLSADPHTAVRQAAEAKASDLRGAMEPILDRIRRVVFRNHDTDPPTSDEDRVDVGAAFDAVIAATVSGAMHKDQGALARRIRTLLVEGDEAVRLTALVALQFLGDERAWFLPELVRAFDSAWPRHIAMLTFSEGGLDLTPARAHLVTMLEHPWWRADVLRAMAANRIDLPPEVLERAGQWMGASDPLLRGAAALLLLKKDPGDERPLQVLDATWSLLPSEWRVQILKAALVHRPNDKITANMCRTALFSAFSEERSAFFRTRQERAFDEAHLQALLDGMEHFGPNVADQCWSRFLHAAAGLPGEDRKRARALLMEHLERWSSAERLPDISGSVLLGPPWPGFGDTQRFVAALDSCLVHSDASILKYSLALLRSEVDPNTYPESPPVREALDRLYALKDAPREFPRIAENELTCMLRDREDVDGELIRSLLLRLARTPPEDSYADVEFFLRGDDERIEQSLALVSRLLDIGTRGSVKTALSVLKIAGPRARKLLPSLRRLATRALPTWRASVQARIASIERQEADKGDD